MKFSFQALSLWMEELQIPPQYQLMRPFYKVFRLNNRFKGTKHLLDCSLLGASMYHGP
ncbi:hypothetical protein AGABI2DRAFT_195476 [Agaricus bisporus var. bisporus H97]|uniref:hypothetical protein n=1 Tax=Agaricus bisporus var. bisporus (strain H97 / ATCC MYA-4626 / FGSC 10389) TaxID=936046 RepID=UPI00029F6D3D|nr:hypothetical protein AGABI2DRAFT_195476 [Agaricus bisporus var. bisporus H97]EKV43312.1 hypothetical protein AGABI2DRAFT_195476 [Agaricus bisporus var. bisporus H97]